MKYVFLFCIGLFSTGYVHSQNTINSTSDEPLLFQINEIKNVDTLCLNEDDDVVSMLKEFYFKYKQAWHTLDKDWTERICLVIENYCTKTFYENIKKEFYENGIEHDMFTADYGLDEESINSFVLSRDDKVKNVYCLTFSVTTESPTQILYKQSVQIQLEIVKEKDCYKINNILNPYSCICNE